MKNQVQLITYPDSLGGNLCSLNDLLVSHFSNLFPGGVHILPPFPSSADRGFAPITYFEIDPKFGSWEEIHRIGEHFDVMVDVMVNHLSRQSEYFKDFARNGRNSPYADLFITLDKIWLDGQPSPEDVSRIFLRRPDHPFVDISIGDTGQVVKVWATFGSLEWSEQIDLDVHSPKTLQLFRDIFSYLHQNYIKRLRLDAVAYVTKKPGTNCFFVEPEIFDFLDWIRQETGTLQIEVLPEIHAPYEILDKLVQHDFYVYDFVLPILVLHAFMSGSNRALQDHLRSCPVKQVTMLDCHDGIPVLPDIVGILEEKDAQKVVQTCLERGANLSRILSKVHQGSGNFDVHQINCTYYSAMNRDDDAYLAARAIQLFAPGAPQIYYVGLLAGENDFLELQRSGEKRAINRHNFSLAEVETALQRPVVQRLMQLIRFRNEYEAFNGIFEMLDAPEGEICLAWKKGASRCKLTVNLVSHQAEIEYIDEAGVLRTYRL